MRRTPAFTLIELLVVVAIVALLVAILLPALAGARGQAKRAACSNNLRELASAWNQYLDDHKGAFLQGVNANYNYGGQQGAAGPPYGNDVRKPLNRYLGLPPVFGRVSSGIGESAAREEARGAEMFLCPSDEGADIARPTIFHNYGTSYLTNRFLIGPLTIDSPAGEPAQYAAVWTELRVQMQNLNIGRINVNPSWLALIGDFGWWIAMPFTGFQRYEWHTTRNHHNIAFLDGHVEFLKQRRGYFVTSDMNSIFRSDLTQQMLDAQDATRDVPRNE